MATRSVVPGIDRLQPMRVAGPSALAAAKTADGVTTILGLRLVDHTRELSPAAALFDVVGVVPAVLGASLAAVLLVVAATEYATTVCRRSAPRSASVVRFVGYVPLVLLWTAVAVRNARVVLGAA